MELASYLGSVGAIATMSLGAMYFIATLLGRRVDDRFDQMDRRFDDRFEQMDRRFDDRFEQMDRRFDDRFEQVDRRFDDRFEQVDRRFDAVDRRLAIIESQNDSIIGAVSDLGQRVARLEALGG